MRSIFLLLLLANLVFFALQFDVVRGALGGATPPDRPPQVNAERLRIIRDTSMRGVTTLPPAEPPP